MLLHKDDNCSLDLFCAKPFFHNWFDCYLEYQEGRERRREGPRREIWHFRRFVGSHFFGHRNFPYFDLSKQLIDSLVSK